jgi:hypothetical protein
MARVTMWPTDHPNRRPEGHQLEVVDLPEVTYRQLDHWSRKGWLRPNHKGGSGRVRHWPSEELFVASRMGRLVRAGVVASVAARVARGESEVGYGVRIEVS